MSQWFEDFSGNTTGQPPAGWTSRWAAESTLTVEEHPEAANGRVAYLNINGGTYGAYSYDVPGVLTSGSFPIRYRGRFQIVDSISSIERRFFAGVHVTGAAGDEYGYILQREGNNVSLGHISAGGNPSQLAASPFQLPADTWAQFLIEVDGDGVRAKIWLDSDSEPGTWLLASNDTSLSSGRIAVLTSPRLNTPDVFPGQRRYDWIGVGTGGQDAPTEPPPPQAEIDAGLTLDASVTAATVLPGADITADMVLDANAMMVMPPLATLSADLVLDTAATAHSPAAGFAWVAPPEQAEVEDTVQLVTQATDPRVAAIRYRIGDTIIGIAEPE